MNATIKSLVVAKSIALAALAAAGVAAPAISHASPDDGMICRGGYQAQANNGVFKCAKSSQRAVALDCVNPRFPNRVVRAPGATGDASGGRDICLALGRGVSIGTTDPLTGLVQGQDFVFAEVSAARVAATREAVEQAEKRALGLGDADVDSQAGPTRVVVNGGFGSADNADFTVTLFTFPIPALNLTRPTVPLQPVSPISGLTPRF